MAALWWTFERHSHIIVPFVVLAAGALGLSWLSSRYYRLRVAYLLLSLSSAGTITDVIDTGGGMSDEVKSHLLEPYFTTKGDQGTGLGLSSVRDLIEASGGRLTVASAVGVGITVAVFLPGAA